MRRVSQKGLTLIEVLIALAIIAIALTAIIKATSQTVRANIYLKQKTMGLWVANTAMTEAKLKLKTLPTHPNKLTEVTTVFGDMWYVEGARFQTPNPFIYKYEISVFDHDPEENEAPIIQLTSFVRNEKKS